MRQRAPMKAEKAKGVLGIKSMFYSKANFCINFNSFKELG
jgi:hypothetical protein